MAVSDKAKKIVFVAIGAVLIAVIIATVIIVSANMISPYRRNNISFSSIKYSRPDYNDIDKAFDEAFANVNGSYMRAVNSVNAAVEELNGLVTSLSYVQIKYTQDYTDPYWSQEYSSLYKKYNEYYNRYYELLYEVLNSKNSDMLSSLSRQEKDQIIKMHGAVDENYIAAQNRITELKSDYNELGSGSGSAQAFASQAGSLLIDLAKNYNVIAQSEGYNNYAEYAYESFGRSYTPSEARQLHSYVKKYLKDVSGALYEKSSVSFKIQGYGSTVLDKASDVINNFLDDIDDKSYVEKVDASMEGYLSESYSYMKRYGQHIKSTNPSGDTGAYSTYLSGYDIPVIFQYMTGSIGDITTFVHEFGHFSSYYYNGQYGGYDLDYAEIQSQALALLFSDRYDELFKEFYPSASDAEIKKYSEELIISDLSDSLVFSVQMGCIMDELQYDVYTNTQNYSTGAEVTEKFDELLEDYFTQSFIESISSRIGYDFKYWWANVSHTFSQPFYYISYAVSAIPSLTIYIDSLNDYSEALKEYHYILRFGNGDYSFSNLLMRAGVDDPFSEITIKNIAEALTEKYI